LAFLPPLPNPETPPNPMEELKRMEANFAQMLGTHENTKGVTRHRVMKTLPTLFHLSVEHGIILHR